MTEYLMGRITIDKLSNEQLSNMNIIVPRANELLEAFGQYRAVTSGYRSKADQDRINPGAPKSKHIICAAVDLEDRDGKLKQFCLKNLDLLKELGLWIEDPKSSPTWLHCQCVSPSSGNRVFKP